MKAKMPPNEKPAEPAEYLCIWCDSTFCFDTGTLICPGCGNGNDLVAIYMENNPQEQVMYAPDEFHGG